MLQKRLTKNQKRRQRKRELKKENPVLKKEVVEKVQFCEYFHVQVIKEKEKEEKPVEEEPTEMVYDSEFEKVKDQYAELQDVFKNFAAIAEAKSEEVIFIDLDEGQTFRTANGIQASSNVGDRDGKQEETAVEEVS